MKNNHQLISKAFTKQSVFFDKMNADNKLTEHLRKVYREEVKTQAKADSFLLELNCGTGIDTIHFANSGFHILSTDNAQGMLDILNAKIKNQQLESRVETKNCSFTHLSILGEKKYDYILSNFGGLNCTEHLDKVLMQFKDHLVPNGKVTLVLMPKISPWEIIMVLKGKFKTAFRRFKKNTPAHIEGIRFYVHYYSPNYIKKILKKDFDILTLRGIYFAVPPEFYKNFVERYPRTFHWLSHIEAYFGTHFPFTHCCDHYLITLQLKSLSV